MSIPFTHKHMYICFVWFRCVWIELESKLHRSSWAGSSKLPRPQDYRNRKPRGKDTDTTRQDRRDLSETRSGCHVSSVTFLRVDESGPIRVDCDYCLMIWFYGNVLCWFTVTIQMLEIINKSFVLVSYDKNRREIERLGFQGCGLLAPTCS